MTTPRDIAKVLQVLRFKKKSTGTFRVGYVSRDGQTDVTVWDNGQWIIYWEEVKEKGKGPRMLFNQLKRFVESKGIREAVRRIVEQEIDEMTGTSGVGGFGTPYAFSTKEPVSSKKKKRVDEAQRAGTIQHHFDGKRWIAISPKGTEKIVVYDRAHAIEFSKTGMIGGNPDWDKRGTTVSHNVNEGGDPYYAWRNDETATPRMKIGKVISEINKQLREMERVVRRTSRLKKEMGLPNSGLWQRTNNSLMKIESRMHRISQTIRNMRG